MDVQIILPVGAMGASVEDDLVDTMCRELSLRVCRHMGEWCDKYGTDYDDGKLMIHRFCWCDEDACPWCGEEHLPNLWHRPSGLKVWWYKYIGRSMEVEGDDSPQNIQAILDAYSPARNPYVAHTIMLRERRDKRRERQKTLRAIRCAAGRHRLWTTAVVGAGPDGEDDIVSECVFCGWRKPNASGS